MDSFFFALYSYFIIERWHLRKENRMMKKALFIDYRNIDQLTWWTKFGSRKCRSEHLDYIVSQDTGKVVGEFVELFGIYSKKILKEGSKFHKNPNKIIINVKK